MNKSQFELLLNNLYSCAIAVEKSILADDEEELKTLIARKSEILSILAARKDDISSCDMSEFNVRIKEIQAKELANINLLKAQRGEVYSEYVNTARTSKILNKYALNVGRNGSIVDVKE